MQGKRVWVLIGCITLLFLAFSAASIYLYTTALTTAFPKSVEWLSHAFADEVSHHISMDDKDEEALRKELTLWTQKVVKEYLLYTQVVKDGRTLAEAKAPQAINLNWPPEVLSSELVVAWKQLPDGTPYLDMRKSLEVPSSSETVSGSSYLRMGVSLARVSSAIRIGTLIIALAGLLSIFASSLLILYFSGMLFTSGRKAEVAPPEVASTELAGALGDPGREATAANACIKVGELLIDDGRKEIHLNGLAPKLSPREYALLKLLASEPDKVFSDEEIIEKIWPEHSLASADDVRKYIRFLRRKLEKDPTQPRLIITVKGFGYKLQA